MRRFGSGLVALCAFCAGALISPPASANGFNGACLVTLHFAFSSPVTVAGGSGSFNVSGSGTCAASGLQAPAATRTVSFTGSGVMAGVRCAPLLLSGSYGVIFSPQPAPPAGNGIFSLNGSASGGAFLMTGSSPQFDGVGVAAGAGLADCASGGASVLSIQIVLAFADP